MRRVSALKRYEVLVIGPVMGGDLQPSLQGGTENISILCAKILMTFLLVLSHLSENSITAALFSLPKTSISEAF